ncbi:MAG: sensor histidine kinase, partial [Candidatus Deferrimicrobiaceae bacterium]
IQRAVEGYVKQFQEQNPIRVDLSFEGDYSSLSAEKQINVFRIIQEAMENVGKHSHAAHARVALRCVNDRCFFLVEDSGNGDRGPKPVRRDAPRSHFGLKIMKERADAMGGVLRYGRTKGGGYSVRGNVPVG